MYCNTGKLILFLFLLDTCLEKPGSNETLTAAKATQFLTSEGYPLSSMIEDLKYQNTISSLDESVLEKKLKKSSRFSYPKRREERSFLSAWYKKWPRLHYNEAEDHVLCIICKNANDHGMLNNVKVEDSFVKTKYSN